jgi:hypothetical protein
MLYFYIWFKVYFTARNFWVWILPVVVGAYNTLGHGPLKGIFASAVMHGVARVYRHVRALPVLLVALVVEGAR